MLTSQFVPTISQLRPHQPEDARGFALQFAPSESVGRNNLLESLRFLPQLVKYFDDDRLKWAPKTGPQAKVYSGAIHRARSRPTVQPLPQELLSVAPPMQVAASEWMPFQCPTRSSPGKANPEPPVNAPHTGAKSILAAELPPARPSSAVHDKQRPSWPKTGDEIYTPNRGQARHFDQPLSDLPCMSPFSTIVLLRILRRGRRSAKPLCIPVSKPEQPSICPEDEASRPRWRTQPPPKTEEEEYVQNPLQSPQN